MSVIRETPLHRRCARGRASRDSRILIRQCACVHDAIIAFIGIAATSENVYITAIIRASPLEFARSLQVR